MKPANLGISLVCLLLGGPVFAEDALPRVLILGDSVYNNLARTVANDLMSHADVTLKRPGDSASALENLDELLGDGKWDVIYFNFGFADLHYKDPSTKTIRAMSKHAGGVRVTPPKEYESNLDKLVTRLEATGADLIWASTTPIIKTSSVGLYDVGSEIEYNALAARVAARHEIAVNDLHSIVLGQIDEKRPPDMFDFRGIDVHTPIVKAIQSALSGR